jgi:hypothetical protein
MNTPDGIATSASTTPFKKLKDDNPRNQQTHDAIDSKRDVAIKNTTDVGVKLRHIYSSGHGSHHRQNLTTAKRPDPHSSNKLWSQIDELGLGLCC